MKLVDKKKKWQLKSIYLYVALLLAALLAITGWIFLKTKYNAHSDWATAALLAREELRTGQLFPDLWVYAQGVWVFSLQVLVLPFQAITGDMMLARQLAVVLQTILVILLTIKGLSKMTSKKGAVLAAILLLVPISTVVVQNHFYEATYNTNNIWLMLLIWDMIAFHESVKRKSKWAYFQGAVLFVLMTILTMPGTKLLATLFLPFFAGLFLFVAMKEKFIIKKMLKHTSSLWILILMGAGIVAGLVGMKILQGSVIFESGVSQQLFTDGSNYMANLWTTIYDFLLMYGCVGSGSVMSLTGAVYLCKWIVCIFFCLVAPIWCIKNYKKLKSNYQRVFVLFSVVSFCMMLFLCIVTPLFSNTPRYLLGIYVNNIILGIFFFDYYIEKSRYYSNLVLICLLVPLFAGSYMTIRGTDAGGYEERQALCDYLEQEEIEYGYATYWNAYVNTVLSDGEVELVAFTTQPSEPFYWLCSKEWFKDEYHEGRFCVVMGAGESLAETYIAAADEVKQIGSYTVYIYEEDSSEYGDLFGGL